MREKLVKEIREKVEKELKGENKKLNNQPNY